MAQPRERQRGPSPARRAAGTAIDIAVGGAVLLVDKALETVNSVVRRGESGARRGVAGRDDKDARPYEDRTRDDLYELASERGIEGRSSMRKAQLIAALRAER